MTQHFQQLLNPVMIIFFSSVNSFKFTFYGRINRNRISISSYFYVFLLFEKISETEEMDGLALRVGWEVPEEAGSLHSPSPHKWNSTAIWWLLHDSWKILWLSRPLFGGQVYIAQRFVTQLMQVKKPRISQAAELKPTLTDREKNQKIKSAIGRGAMGRIYSPDGLGTRRASQKVVFIVTVS